MLLQSHSIFDTVAEYDPSTKQFVEFSRCGDPSRASGPISGSYGRIGEKLILLFRDGDKMYLDIEGQRMCLLEHIIKLQSTDGRRLLRVISNGRDIFDLVYDPPRADSSPAFDPTPFVEDEDFDFGLYLANVSQDKRRQDRMYRP